MIKYILIGIALMFLLEYFTNSSNFKKYEKKYPKAFIKFGAAERVIGILCWPVLLGVFLYNFFKAYFK